MVDEEPELYVCDPVYKKEGAIGHTNYKLKGKLVKEPQNRRYRDFEALRRKLVERWPGIFIPNIINKKEVGNKDEKVDMMRVEMINRFLKKICKIKYLYKSEEMNVFLQNSSNISKSLDGIKLENFSGLLKRFSATFIDYDDNFDTQAGKAEQDEFFKKICENYLKIKSFRSIVLQEKEKYKEQQENYLSIINMLTSYEKETIANCVDNDEDKLVLSNSKNKELGEKLANVQKEVINPYDRLYDAITEDFLNIESMKEALEKIKELHDNYNKLARNLTNLNIYLNELQAGKSSIKSIFVSKDKEISKVTKEKEGLEKDINDLGLIIKIVTFNMQTEMADFKQLSLDNYYAELSRIERDTEKNAKIFDDLWESVVKDKNISEFK